MELTEAHEQEETLKEQVAAKAKRAATMAAATGNVAKGAFLSTMKGATTVGEKAVVFGSLVGILAFFLPWASVSEQWPWVDGSWRSIFPLGFGCIQFPWLRPLSLPGFFSKLIRGNVSWRQGGLLSLARCGVLPASSWYRIRCRVQPGSEGIWLRCLAVLFFSAGCFKSLTALNDHRLKVGGFKGDWKSLENQPEPNPTTTNRLSWKDHHLKVVRLDLATEAKKLSPVPATAIQ
jgi:hypothetical protein